MKGILEELEPVLITKKIVVVEFEEEEARQLLKDIVSCAAPTKMMEDLSTTIKATLKTPLGSNIR
jgi:hypothetical protein